MKQAVSDTWTSDGVIPDAVSDVVELGQENLRALYHSLVGWKDNFTHACRCYDDPGLMLSYNSVVEMTKSLFDTLERMRWHIGEHNVDCGPRGEGNLLSSPEEIQAWADSLKNRDTAEDDGGK